jgi:hypothetical protein
VTRWSLAGSYTGGLLRIYIELPFQYNNWQLLSRWIAELHCQFKYWRAVERLYQFLNYHFDIIIGNCWADEQQNYTPCSITGGLLRVCILVYIALLWLDINGKEAVWLQTLPGHTKAAPISWWSQLSATSLLCYYYAHRDAKVWFSPVLQEFCWT